MTNEILELTKKEIEAIKEIFSNSNNSNNDCEYETKKDIFDDSIQTVKKGK